MKALLRSSKGFYLVSPFLGFFFFLIAVSMTMVVVSENNQQIALARSSQTHQVIFQMYALQADAFDVYFQNFLQKWLDSYQIAVNPQAIRTDLQGKVLNAMASNVTLTYKEIYQKAFNVSCEARSTAWSLVILKLNGPGSKVLKTADTFGPDKVTAAWPYISQYFLACHVVEPPLDVMTDFRSRWYYLDADCICCQGCLGAGACQLVQPPAPRKGRVCQYCDYSQDCNA
jgi:hypothetical protein